nr:terminal deoxycytidyl transferase rev1 [Hymenolepis microstoma]
MNAKIRKLESQFAEQPKKSNIFSGIRIYVNGYTDPPALEIRRLVQEHGGTYVQYYSQSAGDFMVASNLPLTKIKGINNQKIVKVSWITDSIAAGCLLPWKNFELYPPHSQLKNQRALTSLLETKPVSPEIAMTSDKQTLSSHAASGNETVEVSVSNQIGDEPSSFDTSFSPIENVTLTEPLEEQNENLKSQPDKASSVLPTTSDGYISQYYSRSRLHHLSKWAADLRDLVRALRQEHEEGKKGGVDQGEFLRMEVERIQSTSTSPSDSLTEMILECVGESSSSTQKTPRILMHMDMDCFFVSVCLRSRPEFVGLPVAVTHGKGKSDSSMAEVASCSYEARKASFGIKNGMLLGKARALCPELKVVPYEFDAFFSVAEDLYKTVAKFCLQIEAVSCDEMYVDVTDLLKVRSTSGHRVHFTNPFLLGAALRRHVKEATRCTATCGFGTNRLLARLATKRAKPDGQGLLLGPEWKCVQPSFEVEGEKIKLIELASPEGREYLEDLPLAHLPGVGRQMVTRIAEAYGISTCGELLKTATHAQLSSLLGAKTSQRILQLCQGVDSADVTLDRYAKSISAEINYGVRLSSWPEVEKFVKDLAKELSFRLGKAASESRTGFGMVGKNLAVHLLTRRADQPIKTAKYLGHGVCDNFTRTVSLSKASADASVIAEKCLSVLRRLKPNPEDIRGLGLQMHRLSPSSPVQNAAKLNKGKNVGGLPSITRFLKSSGSDPDSQRNISNGNSVVSEGANESSSISDGDDIMSTPSEESNCMIESGLANPILASTSTPISNKESKAVVDSTDILPHQPNRPIEEVNVFAKRSVEDLRNMFATWITTESDPLEEDLCMLADYLISILPTDLARVRCLLRGLLRLIDSELVTGDGLAWKHAFKRLKVTIDAACQRHYDVESLELDST